MLTATVDHDHAAQPLGPGALDPLPEQRSRGVLARAVQVDALFGLGLATAEREELLIAHARGCGAAAFSRVGPSESRRRIAILSRRRPGRPRVFLDAGGAAVDRTRFVPEEVGEFCVAVVRAGHALCFRAARAERSSVSPRSASAFRVGPACARSSTVDGATQRWAT